MVMKSRKRKDVERRPRPLDREAKSDTEDQVDEMPNEKRSKLSSAMKENSVSLSTSQSNSMITGLTTKQSVSYLGTLIPELFGTICSYLTLNEIIMSLITNRLINQLVERILSTQDCSLFILTSTIRTIVSETEPASLFAFISRATRIEVEIGEQQDECDECDDLSDTEPSAEQSNYLFAAIARAMSCSRLKFFSVSEHVFDRSLTTAAHVETLVRAIQSVNKPLKLQELEICTYDHRGSDLFDDEMIDDDDQSEHAELPWMDLSPALACLVNLKTITLRLPWHNFNGEPHEMFSILTIVFDESRYSRQLGRGT